LLDQLPIPGNTGPLTAFITPDSPDTNEAGGPRAYIWETRGDEKRRALPRNNLGQPGTGGWKDEHHALEIYLIYPQADEEPEQDSAFPGVIDAVMNALRTAPNPVFLTDPVTGVQSQLVDLGEVMTWEYAPAMSLAVQRWNYLAALIQAPCLEEIQA
jgi:hypothetical protein